MIEAETIFGKPKAGTVVGDSRPQAHSNSRNIPDDVVLKKGLDDVAKESFVTFENISRAIKDFISKFGVRKSIAHKSGESKNRLFEWFWNIHFERKCSVSKKDGLALKEVWSNMALHRVYFYLSRVFRTPTTV